MTKANQSPFFLYALSEKLRWKLGYGYTRLRTAVLTSAFSARAGYREVEGGAVQVHDTRIADFVWRVAIVQEGSLYTDRDDFIAVMHGRLLVAGVSWRYQSGGAIWEPALFLQAVGMNVHVPPRRVRGRVISLLTGGGGNSNYFHWLFDCLPRLAMVDGVLRRQDSDLYLIPDDLQSFQKQTLALLGIAPERCLTSREYQHIRATALVATNHPIQDLWEIPHWVISFLRSTLMNDIPTIEVSDLIYISRADSTQARRPTNEAEFVPMLRAAGFSILYLTTYSFVEQVAIFSQARVVVATHGAGLSNLVFAKEGTIVYEFFSSLYQPDTYGTLPYGQLCAALGMSYTKIVCAAEDPEDVPLRSSFHLPIEHVEHIVQRVQSIPCR